jgi:hypothetical protein
MLIIPDRSFAEEPPVRVGRKGCRPLLAAAVEVTPIRQSFGQCRQIGDIYINEPPSNGSKISEDRVCKYLMIYKKISSRYHL